MKLKSLEIEQKKQESKQLTDEIKTLKRTQEKDAETEESIKANIEYRTRNQNLIEHNRRLEAEKLKLKKLTKDDTLNVNITQERNLLAKLIEQRSELRGQMTQIQNQVKGLAADLRDPKFLNIETRAKTEVVNLRTQILANQDLDTYYKALNKALMHFHTVKMREINETLRDYWRSVYRGTDIDEIQILHDVEEQPQEGGRKLRNYNYRVVMKQGDVQLDMRGRCSAGQKVLASLLIRLALADTFCLQCGVFALDEPTTNLDSKNITAFAQSLSDIIQKRRSQRNFQLIIITHDENFIKEIGHLDTLYKVSKDSHNHSIIKKQTADHMNN